MFPATPSLPRDTLYTFVKIVRFVNFVKSVLDREGQCGHLRDLLELPFLVKNPRDAEIFAGLILQRRLLCYDLNLHGFVEEPHDKGLLQRFFEQAHGKAIKGFKTGNSLIID